MNPCTAHTARRLLCKRREARTLRQILNATDRLRPRTRTIGQVLSQPLPVNLGLPHNHLRRHHMHRIGKLRHQTPPAVRISRLSHPRRQRPTHSPDFLGQREPAIQDHA